MDLYRLHTDRESLYGFDKIAPQQVWAWHQHEPKEMTPYEQVIKKDPKYAFKYASAMKLRYNGYIVPMEDVMVNDAHLAYGWANEILLGRFKEGEPVIAKDIRFAYQYAFSIIKGRWKEAEDTIATDAMESLKYASNVMQGRFPKGEAKMKEDKQIYDMYVDMVARKKEQRKEMEEIDAKLAKSSGKTKEEYIGVEKRFNMSTD